MNKITLDPRYKKVSFTILVIVILMMALSIFWFFLLFSRPNDSLYGAKDIRGTYFKIYQDNVYVTIPSGGDYLVVGADPNSLTEIGLNHNIAYQLAKDKNHVFCGNKIIPLLDPNNIEVNFGGYISDDKYAYYCDAAKRNPNLSFFEELIGLHKTAFDSDKPQAYYNELIQLASDAPAQLLSITRSYAKDNSAVYYKGNKIDNADPDTFKTVIEITPGDEHSKRGSAYYAQDKNHIYYKGEALPNAKPESTKIYKMQESKLDYAYDQQIDQFYTGSTPFPRVVDSDPLADDKNRYKLDNYVDGKPQPSQYNTDHLQFLTVTNRHSNHDLFFNQQGIFYWDYRQQELMVACSVPFNTKESHILSDGFIADKDNSYFVKAAETWRKGRSDKSLASRQTQVMKISHIGLKDWQKFAIVKDQHTSTLGTLWKANDQYYFEANWGKGNDFQSTLYKVKNIESLIPEKLVYGKDEKMDVLILEDKTLSNYLVQITSDPICEAKTHYPSAMSFW